MKPPDRAFFLCERLGPAAKAVIDALLEAALPHSPGAALLAWRGLDRYRRVKNAWVARKRTTPAPPPGERVWAAGVLELLADELLETLSAMAGRWDDPDGARRFLADAVAGDDGVGAAVGRLAQLGEACEGPGLPVAGVRDDFTEFPLRDGLTYGCWRLWLRSRDIGLLLVNGRTGTFVRLWLACNGWFNYRTSRVCPGRMFTVYSSGSQMLGPGTGYTDTLDQCGPPRWVLPEGSYPAREWRVVAGPEDLSVQHTDTGRVLVFQRHRPEWACSDANWNDPLCFHVV
jgi:hypothetical protein